MDGNTGWICPRCKSINAPFVTKCDCTPIAQIETICTTQTGNAGWQQLLTETVSAVNTDFIKPPDDYDY